MSARAVAGGSPLNALAHLHRAPFSARKGTPAAEFADEVPPEIRRTRMQRLAALERELAPRYYETQIGRTLEVLVERVCDDQPGRVRGTDRHSIPVELPGTPAIWATAAS